MEPASGEVSSEPRPVTVNNAIEEPKGIEEAPANQEGQPLLVEDRVGEAGMASGTNGNVGVMSPNLVNPVPPMSHDLIWPSQLQVRRERLFPEGAIHPN